MIRGVYACVLRRVAASELQVSSWLVVQQVPPKKTLKRGQWGHRESTSLETKGTFCRQAMQSSPSKKMRWLVPTGACHLFGM